MYNLDNLRGIFLILQCYVLVSIDLSIWKIKCYMNIHDHDDGCSTCPGQSQKIIDFKRNSFFFPQNNMIFLKKIRLIYLIYELAQVICL